jgi:hypothetical protein
MYDLKQRGVPGAFNQSLSEATGCYCLFQSTLHGKNSYTGRGVQVEHIIQSNLRGDLGESLSITPISQAASRKQNPLVVSH